MPASHTQLIRVYFEDTDAGGIVYHASWLRFFERCRTDWLRALGISQSDFARETGQGFVVRDLQIEYLRPARLDDLIQVDLQVSLLRKASIVLTQSASRAGQREPLVTAQVRVAMIDQRSGLVRALPKMLHDRIRMHSIHTDSEELRSDAQ